MDLNLELTMESGQPPHFIWNKEGSRYWRMVRGERVEVWMEDGRLRCTDGFYEYASRLLRMDDNLEEIYKRIATDDVMERAIASYRGLRITRNDPWETLVCFICSINNNIPRIRRMVQSLMVEGEMMAPEEMRGKDLGRFGVGYRERYLKGCAEFAASCGLDWIKRMDYDAARAELQQLPGVGPKVADCVLLFGFGFLEAFPVDVWIKRAMMRLYNAKSERDIQNKARERWGEYAGYAQQYLYCFARSGCAFQSSSS
jgi:N-glycosylase/DNA lyase